LKEENGEIITMLLAIIAYYGHVPCAIYAKKICLLYKDGVATVKSKNT